MDLHSRIIPGSLVEAGILVGGRSRRMGADKASLTAGGRSLLQIAVEKVRPLVGRIYLCGGEHRYPGTHSLRDDVPGEGALGAIATLLAAARAQRMLVLAVDLPLVATETLRRLLDLSREADIFCVCTPDGRRQPLCAVYSGSCLEPARQLVGSGRLRVEGLLEFPGLRVRSISCEQLGCTAVEFLNVNTPADLSKARELLGEAGLRRRDGPLKHPVI